MDRAFVALVEKKYDEVFELIEKIDRSIRRLDQEKARKIYAALDELEHIVKDEQKEILSQIKKLQDLKKFQF